MTTHIAHFQTSNFPSLKFTGIRKNKKNLQNRKLQLKLNIQKNGVNKMFSTFGK